MKLSLDFIKKIYIMNTDVFTLYETECGFLFYFMNTGVLT